MRVGMLEKAVSVTGTEAQNPVASSEDAFRENAQFQKSSQALPDRPLMQKKERLYRAIECTQAFLHRKVPPDEAMAAVRARFPAPKYFLESNRTALENAGLDRMDAWYYAMIPALTRTVCSQQWGMAPKLDTLSRMAPFLKTLYVGVHVECFYLILLNRQGKLIRHALMQRGSVNSAPFYLGQMLTTALVENASYIVLAHNHPGGTQKPSREDLHCTLRALNAVAPMGLPMLDHIIVAGEHIVSIRALDMLPPLLWTASAPESRIMRHWLNG